MLLSSLSQCRRASANKGCCNRCFIAKDVDYCCHGRLGFVQMLSSLMHFFSPECCIDSLKIPTLCLDCSCLIILLKLRAHVVGSLQQHPFSNTALRIFSRSFMGFIKKKNTEWNACILPAFGWISKLYLSSQKQGTVFTNDQFLSYFCSGPEIKAESLHVHQITWICLHVSVNNELFSSSKMYRFIICVQIYVR